MRLAAILPPLALVAIACKAPTETSTGIDVYVPGVDGGDAAALPESGADGGFGLGQIDRAGRPLVAVLLVPSALQDEYNAQPSFEPTQPRVLQNAVASRLAELDSLDVGDAGADPVDWPDGGALLPMLLGDTLLVDTSLSCVSDGGFVPSYLDIEQQVFLGGPTHTTCGGRTPAEHVIDESLQLLVTGDREGGPVVAQGIAGPTKPPTLSFPYLAPPN
ncbi:MAG TPA: hypothetical protein VF765_16800 [Polyangiaceae bacterium]